MLQRGPLPTSGIDSSVLLAPWCFASYTIFPPKKGVRTQPLIWHCWRQCLPLPEFREWAGPRAVTEA